MLAETHLRPAQQKCFVHALVKFLDTLKDTSKDQLYQLAKRVTHCLAEETLAWPPCKNRHPTQSLCPFCPVTVIRSVEDIKDKNSQEDTSLLIQTLQRVLYEDTIGTIPKLSSFTKKDFDAWIAYEKERNRESPPYIWLCAEYPTPPNSLPPSRHNSFDNPGPILRFRSHQFPLCILRPQDINSRIDWLIPAIFIMLGLMGITLLLVGGTSTLLVTPAPPGNTTSQNLQKAFWPLPPFHPTDIPQVSGDDYYRWLLKFYDEASKSNYRQLPYAEVKSKLSVGYWSKFPLLLSIPKANNCDVENPLLPLYTWQMFKEQYSLPEQTMRIHKSIERHYYSLFNTSRTSFAISHFFGTTEPQLIRFLHTHNLGNSFKLIKYVSPSANADNVAKLIAEHVYYCHPEYNYLLSIRQPIKGPHFDFLSSDPSKKTDNIPQHKSWLQLRKLINSGKLSDESIINEFIYFQVITSMNMAKGLVNIFKPHIAITKNEFETAVSQYKGQLDLAIKLKNMPTKQAVKHIKSILSTQKRRYTSLAQISKTYFPTKTVSTRQAFSPPSDLGELQCNKSCQGEDIYSSTPEKVLLNDSLITLFPNENMRLANKFQSTWRNTHRAKRSALRIPNMSNPTDKNFFATELHQKQTLKKFLSDEQINLINNDVKHFYFLAYHCEKPSSPKVASSFADPSCHAPANNDILQTSNELRFQLLHKQSVRKFKAFKCSVKRTQYTQQCGSFDHNVGVPQLSFYNQQMDITEAECRRLAQLNSYVDLSGQIHSNIKKNIKTTISYFLKGDVYVTQKSPLLSWEVACIGSHHMIQAKNVSDIYIYIQDVILWREENLILREDDALVAQFENVLVPCPIKAETCDIGLKRLVWNTPNLSKCNLLHTKYFTARKIKNKQNQLVSIMSTDGSRLRFIETGTIHDSDCNRDLLTTNYDNLYLLQLSDTEATPTENSVLGQPELAVESIDKDNIKLSLYIAQKDDYVKNELLEAISKEFAHIQKTNCKQQFDNAKFRHYVSRNMNGLSNYMKYGNSFGGNSFSITAGEVVYIFQCEPVVVKAVQTRQCFSKLPVKVAIRLNRMQLTESDLLDWVPAETQPHNSGQKLFLDPITHRLSRLSTEKHCDSQFPDLFKDLLNRWFTSTRLPEDSFVQFRQSHITPAPAVDYSVFSEIKISDWTKYSDTASDKTGIYNPDMIDSALSTADNAMSPILSKLVHQITDYDPSKPLLPQNIFPTKIMDATSVTSLLFNPLAALINQLGDITAKILGFYYIIKFSYIIVGKLYLAMTYYKTYGLNIRILYSLCPEIHNTMRMRKAKEDKYGQRPSQPISEMLSQAFTHFTKHNNRPGPSPQKPNDLYPNIDIGDIQSTPLRNVSWKVAHEAARPVNAYVKETSPSQLYDSPGSINNTTNMSSRPLFLSGEPIQPCDIQGPVHPNVRPKSR